MKATQAQLEGRSGARCGSPPVAEPVGTEEACRGTHPRAGAAGQSRAEAFQGGRDGFWHHGFLLGLRRAAGGSFLPAHTGSPVLNPKESHSDACYFPRPLYWGLFPSSQPQPPSIQRKLVPSGDSLGHTENMGALPTHPVRAAGETALSAASGAVVHGNDTCPFPGSLHNAPLGQPGAEDSAGSSGRGGLTLWPPALLEDSRKVSHRSPGGSQRTLVSSSPLPLPGFLLSPVGPGVSFSQSMCGRQEGTMLGLCYIWVE